ncbi:DUF4123 domain-containing protein [Pseudomonas orientalis]|uniref:DUF4123 domain-containing protein n=1 Tax=Pseudomonas orientalis TaxID=76758 RepID=A0A1H2H0U2_9PSED|nr:DUF4123 domain-containing protein [Pseudomonas orientalis]KRP64591.1 hypothetical protein TU82_16595 [Pseudomonas orientalis]SDU25497.1 protein of unknown function [Pseudomonas orientalis]
MHRPMDPRTWLAQFPLRADERIYAVLGNVSDAKPLAAWQAAAAGPLPQAIWAGTAYAQWQEVMPYVGIVEPDSAFFDWVAAAQATDWGWLAVSSSALESVVAHLQSLSKVVMPDDQAVFFRFWDGAWFQPMWQQLGDEAGKVLPVFGRYLINGQPLTVATGPVTPAQVCPWWRVPASLLRHMEEQSPRVLIDNLLQWLQEQRPDLYAAYTPATLQHKLGWFTRRPGASPAALVDYLASQLS